MLESALQLLKAIKKRPGSAYQTLMAEAGIRGYGSFYSAVKALKARGKVREVRRGGRVLLFPASSRHDPRLASHMAALHRGTAQEVAKGLLDHPGATPVELAAHLGLSPRVTYYHLDRLRGVGLAIDRGGWPSRYDPGPGLRTALMAISR